MHPWELSKKPRQPCLVGAVLKEKKKRVFHQFSEKDRGDTVCFTAMGPSLLQNLAVGGSWELAVGGWLLVALGGWLFGCWSLMAVGGWRLAAVGG